MLKNSQNSSLKTLDFTATVVLKLKSKDSLLIFMYVDVKVTSEQRKELAIYMLVAGYQCLSNRYTPPEENAYVAVSWHDVLDQQDKH